MKQTLYLLLFLVSLTAYGQVHEIIITDTAYIDYRVSEDSTIDFLFKNRKKIEGHWIAYYDESKKNKAIEATFKKGKLSGTEKQWYDNGQLMMEGNNSGDTSLWTYKKWYADGNLYSERKCMNDTCTIDYFYKNGVLMERDIQAFDAKGIRNWFYSATYCDNGQIKFSPPLNPDNRSQQLITSFYCNGAKKAEFTLQLVGAERLRTGPYTEWFENGVLKVLGYYDDDNPGKKTGTWNYYNADNKLLRQERYEDGKVAESMDY